MEIFVQLYEFILQFLPKDPFIEYINNLSIPQYVNYVNWFVPVTEILNIMSIWLTAVAAYYLISVVLRKAGVIQ